MSAEPLTPISRFEHPGIPFDERCRLPQQRAEGNRLLTQGARTREHEHVLHDPVQGVETRDDVEQNRAIALIRGHSRRDDLQRTANACNRVLHFMRDDGGHLAELGERLLFGEALLERNATAEVVKDAGECRFAVQVHSADREMDGKRAAVSSQGLDFAAGSDDLRDSRLEVVGDVAVVLLAIGAGHQQLDVLANHFFRGSTRTIAPRPG